MASLYIKDADTAELVARLAKRTGQTKTALVRGLAAAREAELDLQADRSGLRETLAEFYKRFPPTSPKATPDHKPFLDAMWGDPD